MEDNLANVALMRDLIGMLDGVELLVSSTAEGGIALARSARPQVILMDINLPGMNGFEALRALQASEETSGIPVIALTAAALGQDLSQAAALEQLHDDERIARLRDAEGERAHDAGMPQLRLEVGLAAHASRAFPRPAVMHCELDGDGR